MKTILASHDAAIDIALKPSVKPPPKRQAHQPKVQPYAPAPAPPPQSPPPKPLYPSASSSFCQRDDLLFTHPSNQVPQNQQLHPSRYQPVIPSPKPQYIQPQPPPPAAPGPRFTPPTQSHPPPQPSLQYKSKNIMILGDSILDRFSQSKFATTFTANHHKVGMVRSLENGSHELRTVFSKPGIDAYVLTAGVNDLKAENSKSVLFRTENLAHHLLQQTGAKVILSAILPTTDDNLNTNIESYNQQLEQLVTRMRRHYPTRLYTSFQRQFRKADPRDLLRDWIHPNDDGLNCMLSDIKFTLYKAFGIQPATRHPQPATRHPQQAPATIRAPHSQRSYQQSYQQSYPPLNRLPYRLPNRQQNPPQLPYRLNQYDHAPGDDDRQ